MAYSEVTIELNPPRRWSVNGKKLVFSADGLPDITLPAKCTHCTTFNTPSGSLAAAITLPRGIAEREKLIEPVPVETNEPDRLYERVLCAAITGLCTSWDGHEVTRGDASNIVEAARKIADKAVER